MAEIRARYPLFSESTAASLPSPLAQLPTRSTSPLFPASPPDTSPSPIASTSAAPTGSQGPSRAPSMERRTSRSKSVREPDSGAILLSTPSADSFSLHSASSVHHNSHGHHPNPAGSPSPSMSASLAPPPGALPSHIALPMAPHLLPSSNLAVLPIEQLVALVMALSQDRDSKLAQLETRQRECEALETVCMDAGVGAGEVDRAKVRARVAPNDNEPEPTIAGKRPSRSAPIRSREWRIALLPPSDLTPTSSASAIETSEQSPAPATHLSQVDLDLDDLAEAMGENAFQVPNTGADTANEGASSDPAMDITPSSTISKAKTGNRGRHASLSSRLFGSILLAGTSSSPPPAPVPDLASSTATKDVKKGRHKRSDSAQSSSSIASGTSSIVCNDSVKSDEPTISPTNKAPYEGWIGWKNWRAKEKKSTLASSVFETETTSSIRSSGEPDDARSVRVDSPTIDVDSTANVDEDELATPMPKADRSSDFFAPTSPTRPKKGSNTSQPRADEAVSPLADATGPIPSTSPPAASLLSEITTVTATSADESSSLVSPTESDTSPTSSATPDRKPRALDGPSSPILTRPRLPSTPGLSHQQAQGASISATEIRASLSRTSSSWSSYSSRRASSAVQDDLSTSAATIEEAVTAIESAVQGLQVVQEDGDTTSSSAPGADPSASSISTPPESLKDAPTNADRTIKSRRRVSADLSERKSPALVQAIMTPAAKEPPPASAVKNPGYVASAKGAFGRALGFGSTPSSPKMTRSPSEGVRRASGASSTQGEPNLTLFPKLPTLSKYSPAAPAALSTPSTVVSLSAHATPSVTSPPPMPITPTISSSAAIPPTMMELGVISGEAAPPTLALHNPTSGQAASAGEEGPMVDRYGFVYDVRSGMKLLREARKKQERSSGNGGSRRVFTDMGHDDDEENRIVVVPASNAGPAVEAVQSQAELDAELEMLREALGIPPPLSSSASSPTAFRSPPGPRSPVPSLAPTSSTNASSTPRAPQLTRTVSSDRPTATASISSSTAPTSGPQSMKRLLTQLREMSDVQDQKRKLEWDMFISKRQIKLAKIGSSGMSGSTSLHNGLDDGKDSTHSGAARKRGPRSVVVQSDQINAFSNGSDDEGSGSRGRAMADEQAWRCEDLVGVSQMGVDGKSGKEDWAEFKQLVRKGVPIAYRPKIWAECSGANEAREPGVYQDLLAHKNEENQCLNQIDMDCHRTFPTNVFFAGTGPGVAKLRNVLVAYSRHNPLIGYCQGMNNLTATLLLTHPAEEDAFWVLVCIIEKILPSDYYTSHLLVSQADQRVLKDLVVRLMPELAAHLEDLGVELPAITFGWFLSLFTDALPIQTLLRIWDLIFVFGTIMLFRIAVAILKVHETEILSCDSAATLYALMRAMTTHLYQVDKLLKIACEDLRAVIKDREVSTLRMKHVNDLQQELGIFPEERRE